MNKRQVDVAIVGGGPGGLAAAHGVLRAKPNAKVVVLEKRNKLIEQGAGMVMLPNGLRALGACSPEALERVLTRKRNSNATRMVNGMTGEEKIYTGNPSWDEKERKYGIRPNSLAWFQLQQDLAKELPSGILALGSCVTSMKDADGGVKINVANSDREETEIHTRLVIGADGYFSRVRASIFNDGPPKYAGSRLWRALVPRMSDEITSIVFSGEHHTLLYYAVDEFTACWTVSKLMPEPERLDKSSMQSNSGEEFGEKALEEVLGLVHEDLVKFPELNKIVMATDCNSVTTHGTYIRDPFKSEIWKPATGPYTLLGDAAHPMRPVGQGVNMAMEDAAELACCLKQFGISENALRQYEKRRIPRATRVAQTSQQQGLRAYKNTGEAGSKLDIMPIPNYLRVQNFNPDMDTEDWLNDIRYPDVRSIEEEDNSIQQSNTLVEVHSH